MVIAENLSYVSPSGDSILNNISFTYKNGVMSVLGHNGCGKTTLMRLIAGYIKPTCGKLEVNSKVFMVNQTPFLLRRSIEGNIIYCLKKNATLNGEHRDYVEHYMSLVDLNCNRRKNASDLSGGQKQKLSLAMAFAYGPDLILLDEPTANIDYNSEIQIERTIKKHSNIGFIINTHIISQASRLSDTIMFMHEGEVDELKSKEQFFKKPESDKARLFISNYIGAL